MNAAGKRVFRVVLGCENIMKIVKYNFKFVNSLEKFAIVNRVCFVATVHKMSKCKYFHWTVSCSNAQQQQWHDRISYCTTSTTLLSNNFCKFNTGQLTVN